MKHFTALLVLSGLTSLMGLSSAHAAPMPSAAGLGKQVVTVTQNVGDNNMSAVRASVAPLVNSTRGYGTALATIAVAVPEAVATIPPVPVYPGMKESAILAAASAHFKSNGPALAGRMGSWMKQNGLAFGWFTYTQKIMLTIPKASGTVTGSGGSFWTRAVKAVITASSDTAYQPMLMAVTDDGSGGSGGGTTTAPTTGLAPGTDERLLVWTMNTDQNGRLLFGNPVIVPPRPKNLYVVYTPLAVEKGLPANWQYPNAGTLFVQTRDENHVPIPGTDERIDVHGAFDEPTEVLGETTDSAPAYNTDSSLACLMDNNSGGCTSSISVRSLMDERGANFAVVDYLRKVQPVYDEGANGELLPRSKLAINKREVQYNGCSNVLYYNEGNYLFELKSTATRYMVTQGGAYGAVGESTFTDTSPSVSYTGQLAVQAADVPKLNSYVINPVDPTNPKLVAIADMVVGTVAPLVTTGNPRQTLVYRTTGYIPTGSNQLSAHVYVGCDMSTGTLSVSAGWQDVGSDITTYWSPNVNRYSIGAQLAKGTPGSATIYSREDPRHGYCSGTVAYDGNNTISLNMSANCSYGDRLIEGTATTTDSNGSVTYDHAGLGSLFPQYCATGTPGTATGQMLGQVIGYVDQTQMYMPGIVNASATGCLYGQQSGLQIPQADVMAGVGACLNPSDTTIFTEQTPTVVDGYITDVTYNASICVARSYPTWNLSW